MVPLREVAPGVLVATSRVMQTNTTVVVESGRALLIDPGWMPDELDALAAALRKRGLTVAEGFATHAHHDHLLWHPSFGDVPRRASGRSSPPGHTAVWLPGPRVLVAGDMLSDVELPLPFDPDDVPAYERALDVLEPYARAARVVIPGHGSVGSDALARLAADRRYLADVRQTAESCNPVPALLDAPAPARPRIRAPSPARADAPTCGFRTVPVRVHGRSGVAGRSRAGAGWARRGGIGPLACRGGVRRCRRVPSERSTRGPRRGVVGLSGG